MAVSTGITYDPYIFSALGAASSKPSRQLGVITEEDAARNTKGTRIETSPMSI